MSKRRISQKDVSRIGADRIARLMALSEQAVRDGREDRARRYVDLARRIGMKTRTGIPKEWRYCKGCLLPMMPGLTCTVRLSNHKVCVTCGSCGTVRRKPYLEEQRT